MNSHTYKASFTYKAGHGNLHTRLEKYNHKMFSRGIVLMIHLERLHIVVIKRVIVFALGVLLSLKGGCVPSTFI